MKTSHCILFIGMCCATISIPTAAFAAKKNTGASRTWHELKVIHNVQFNGELAYKEGIDALNQAHQDNFASMLPLYPVSDHQAAESSASSMDKAIEKCRKSIKLHSIKERPKNNPKKRDNAKYQNWLKNKEFNSQMYRAWLMLGKSEFHKGDFLGSVGTFNYVERLYENDPNMVSLCQLWVVRAYAEMGWLYEAEDLLSKVKVDDLKQQNKPFYSAVSADVHIKAGRYKDAIPYVKVARHAEKRKEYLPRFEYVLAQLYQANQQRADARGAYKRVYKLHPKDVNMEFNARLHYAELQGDTVKSIKQLRRMTKLYKYRDRLDQLFGVMGNVYLNNKDTARALDCYHKGIEGSTQNGEEKGRILVIAGDIYFDRQNYAKASPCYHEAAQILQSDHPDYKRVSHRSEVLDEIVLEVGAIELQDSLQRLGHLPQEEQIQIIEKVIADIKEKERQDSIALAEQAREAELAAESGGLQSVNLSKMVGNRTGEAANWYFYNPQLMRTGKQEFMQKWGNRALEDNWRRMSKTTATATIANNSADNNLNDSTSQSTKDSTSTSSAALSTDMYSVEYYLQQIPKTEQDYAASELVVADAMYNLFFLYRDKLQDIPLSEKTFADFLNRFANDERILDLLYDRYLNALRQQNDSIAIQCRQQILTHYPESAQANIVADPNYFESLRRMANEQDSLYQITYEAYKRNAFADVKRNTSYAEEHYPLTPLMPRLLFLNAVATAKLNGQEPFVAALQDMVQRYPENELSAMAKDMLAMMGQGMEAQQGGTASSLTEQRQATTQEDTEQEINMASSFSDERREKSFVYIVIPNDEAQLNSMLYEVALFNFSQFLIKDFDLRKVPVFTLSNSALEIAGFESMDEADWYISILKDNADMQALLQPVEVIVLPITETNLQRINHPFSLDEYIQYHTTTSHP